jgi:hypothetical protein
MVKEKKCFVKTYRYAILKKSTIDVYTFSPLFSLEHAKKAKRIPFRLEAKFFLRETGAPYPKVLITV